MYNFSKYMEIFKINNKNYIFNLNNGCLIEVDDSTIGKMELFKNGYQEDILNDLERQTLIDNQFLVSEGFDEKQEKINHLTYSISKYNNNKDFLKVDFALTDKCNFNSPYCFECNNLSRNHEHNCKSLIETGNELYSYISKFLEKGIKKVEIVFYGGEPTLEKDFVADYIKRIYLLCKEYNTSFQYVFITNGFLFTKDFSDRLPKDCCKFIQITIDGEKEFHNQRRTNLAKINTFDKIIENVNQLISNRFYVVIRLNIDKSNFESVLKLVDGLEKFIDLNNKKYLGFDIARVFGNDNSFDLDEFETFREVLTNKLLRKGLIKPRLSCKALTTFCVAESLSNDLVLDYKGNLYRCWNNVFDDKYKINTLQYLINNNLDPLEYSKVTLDFIENLSLENVNSSECFKCKYCKYCQGLCPAIRKSIINGEEKNIYKGGVCKEIIKERIKNEISFIGV